MATKLHQILALAKAAHGVTESEVTRAYHDAQRTALFGGLTRVYKANDADDTEYLPPERKMVQMTADDVLTRAVDAWTRQADVVATKDLSNTRARADVIVDGTVVLSNVPVTTLLYLEKMLTNVAEMIKKLPVLDPEVEWGNAPDAATGLWKSAPEKTVRTKKVPKAFTKAPATDKHPAQVDVYTEDVQVGTWEKTLFSGALPAATKLDLMRRAQTLRAAVVSAREYANQADVTDAHVGAAIFDYLLSARITPAGE